MAIESFLCPIIQGNDLKLQINSLTRNVLLDELGTDHRHAEWSPWKQGGGRGRSRLSLRERESFAVAGFNWTLAWK